MPKVRKNIFLDLDGTLIDARQRMYQLFMELMPQATFSFDDYWRIKRDRTPQSDLLGRWFDYTPDQIAVFKKVWLERIEDEKRLHLDSTFEGTTEVLRNLSQNHDLYLITARQKPDLASQQIEAFGWTDFFKKLLITQQALSKLNLIKDTVAVRSDDVFIGDTGEDITAAKELGVTSVAVCSGFLCRKILEEYQPDYLIDSVSDIHETGLL